MHILPYKSLLSYINIVIFVIFCDDKHYYRRCDMPLPNGQGLMQLLLLPEYSGSEPRQNKQDSQDRVSNF